MRTWLCKRNMTWTLGGLAVLVPATIGGAFGFGLVGGDRSGPASPAATAQTPPAATSTAPSSAVSGPVAVKTVRPTRQHLKREITQPAPFFLPHEQTDIFAKLSGYLRCIHVDSGDKVTKGQTLAELSIPELEQERAQKTALVEQAKAELGQAEVHVDAARETVEAVRAKVDQAQADATKFDADVIYREGEYKRYVQLANRDVASGNLVDKEANQLRAAQAYVVAAKAAVKVSQANLKVEEANLAKARADVESAKARLKVAEANLEYTKIMLGYAKIPAPYDGIVTRRHMHTGAFIQSAASGKPDPLLTLIRIDKPLRIVADIPEREAGWVKTGQPVTVEVKSLLGQKPRGKVARVSGALDDSKQLRIEVELDEPSAQLRPGMYGYVTITVVDDPKALVIPVTALLPNSARPSVMVVESGRCRPREVELGFNDGTMVQVTAGLTGAEQVVADGRAAVREGQAVEVTK